MSDFLLLERARQDSGLTQDEVARRAGTSRPTLSAYEHGRKSPTLETAGRVLGATGHEFAAVPVVEFERLVMARGRSAWIPSRLWRLPIGAALGKVRLPLHLEWSTPGRSWDLSDRGERARVYEATLREGEPNDIRSLVDGVLLVDLWGELGVPRALRSAWDVIIDAEFQGGGS